MRSFLAKAKNALISEDVPVEQYVENNLCTILGTLKTPANQRMIFCRTCNLEICLSCANVCHETCFLDVSKVKKGICGCGVRGGSHCRTLSVLESDTSDEGIRNKIMEELTFKWQRPITQVTVGQDLPRLGPKHEIQNEKGELIFPVPSTNLEKSFSVVNGIFSCLSTQFNALDIYNEFFEPCFVNFMGDDAPDTYDLAGSVNDFCDTKFGEKHPITKLLKASVCQGIVSPVWLHIKMHALKDFPFKDMKNGWAVFVYFTTTNVIVVHRKREQAQCSPEEEPPFVFVWELKMKFDRNMNEMVGFDFGITEWTDAESSDLTDISARTNARKPIARETFLPPEGMLISDYENQEHQAQDTCWSALASIIASCDVSPVFWKGEHPNLPPSTYTTELDEFEKILNRLKAPVEAEKPLPVVAPSKPVSTLEPSSPPSGFVPHVSQGKQLSRSNTLPSKPGLSGRPHVGSPVSSNPRLGALTDSPAGRQGPMQRTFSATPGSAPTSPLTRTTSVSSEGPRSVPLPMSSPLPYNPPSLSSNSVTTPFQLSLLTQSTPAPAQPAPNNTTPTSPPQSPEPTPAPQPVPTQPLTTNQLTGAMPLQLSPQTNPASNLIQSSPAGAKKPLPPPKPKPQPPPKG